MDNKTVILRLADEVWNKGNISVIDEIVALDYVGHTRTRDVYGPAGFKQDVISYRVAFPDIRFTIEDIVAEGDKVVTRWTSRGTHKGDLMGIAPTGRQVTVAGMNLYRLSDYKLVERWGIHDDLGMLQQLGMHTDVSLR